MVEQNKNNCPNMSYTTRDILEFSLLFDQTSQTQHTIV